MAQADQPKHSTINWRSRIVRYDKIRASEITPHPQNPRRHPQFQRDVVAASFEELGQIAPIVINVNNGYLVDGEERSWLALDQDDDVELDVIYVDLTEEEHQKALLYLDHSASLAEIDAQRLDDLLRDVNSDQPAIQQMLAELAENNGLYGDEGSGADDPGAQIDRAAELQEQWQVKRGDLYVIPSKSGKGEHRLLCGDSTNADDVARVMGGERAALAWFDPPFGIDLVPQRGLTDTIANDGNADARELWAKFLPLLVDALNVPAHVFLCQDWTEFEWTLPLIRQYFTVKSKIVWVKNVWGIGYYTRPKHEDVIYCWNGEPPTIDEPVADVWEVARESAPDHVAEKPPALSSIAIQHFSSYGDCVVDWFSGVGGSSVACEQLGRQCRAIEIEPKYCAVTLERMFQLTGERPFLATS